MGIVIKGDATKANPSWYEDYKVNFTGELAQYNGSVSVKFKHLTAQGLASCQSFNEEGELNAQETYYNVFKKCAKEIHGLTKEVMVNGSVETVDMTIADVCNFSALHAETDDGKSALSVIFTIIYDTAKAILEKSLLTENELKN